MSVGNNKNSYLFIVRPHQQLNSVKLKIEINSLKLKIEILFVAGENLQAREEVKWTKDHLIKCLTACRGESPNCIHDCKAGTGSFAAPTKA
jgi:hypothetical protein